MIHWAILSWVPSLNCKYTFCIKVVIFSSDTHISYSSYVSVASTTTYPLQVIKARLQQRSQVIEVSETTGEVIVSKREYSGVLDCTRRIIKNEGMNGFFKGCVTNALRVAPSAAITFVTYEFVLDMLSD